MDNFSVVWRRGVPAYKHLMRFSDGFLDEIRQRLTISEVVGEYVTWDKRKSQPGKGDYWACCPFHGEKTPSFHADDKRGIYHCFGCGATGDHFRFLTERGGMSFPEAVERLAARAGLPLPARDEAASERAEARQSLYDVMELATRYFEAALADNVGARVRGYLFERGVPPAMVARFRLGFAPDSRNGLKEFLAANDVTAAQMRDAGLVAEREGEPLAYDRFRNRLMFPITDMRGRVIAFGGRALSPDVPAKYLNSPETELFHKRATLYNGKDAREAARQGKAVIVVEGYLDVMAAVAAGFEGAVAPLGTALTEEHMGLLWRMTDSPVLCFDGDAAGLRAAQRAAGLILPLLKPGRTASIATLPEGLDPDDLIRRDGRDAFDAVIGRARPLSEAIWMLETGGGLPETPEARAALEVRLRERASAIADPAVRRHYLQAFDERLAELFGASRGGGRERGRRFGPGRPAERLHQRGGAGGPISEALRNSRLVRRGPAAQASPREAAILVTLVNHPSLAEDRIEQLAALELGTSTARGLLAAILDIVVADHAVDAAGMAAMLGARGFGPAVDAMRRSLARQGVWQVGPDTAEADAEIGLRHALALHYKSVELNRELKAAEIALGSEPSEGAYARLQDIKSQITTVEGTEALIEGFGSLSGRAMRNF